MLQIRTATIEHTVEHQSQCQQPQLGTTYITSANRNQKQRLLSVHKPKDNRPYTLCHRIPIIE
jgi:hypothetical protein